MLKIVGEVDTVDLRTLRIRSPDLEKIAVKHHLQNYQAVLFVNKNRTRLRLVANIEGIAHLLIAQTSDDGVMFTDTAAVYMKLARKQTQRQIAELVTG